MAFEKRWAAIPASAFTANGGTIAAGNAGLVTILSTIGYHEKQQIFITAIGKTSLELEVKAVISATEMYVGSPGVITGRYDLSGYTVAASAQIQAPLQPRPSIPEKEYMRATFEEAPASATRSILVDDLGDKYNTSNPLPVTPFSQFFGSLTLGSLGMPVLFTQCLTDVQYDQVTSTLVGNIETLYFYSDGTLVDTIVITYTVDGWSFQCAGIPGESFLLLEDGGWITLEDNSGFILLE